MVHKTPRLPIKPTDLYAALASISDPSSMERFMKDLCTPAELTAFQERWLVCQLLHQGSLSYRQIHELTGVSLTTISRVARFLKDEPHRGYHLALENSSEPSSSSQGPLP